MFVTAQPNAQVRFRRAIERRALWLAEDAARELPNLPLEDALQLVHLDAERGYRSTRGRRPPAVPVAVRRRVRPSQLGPGGVQVGTRGRRLRRERDALHASALGDLVGVARGRAGERRGEVCGHVVDDAPAYAHLLSASTDAARA